MSPLVFILLLHPQYIPPLLQVFLCILRCLTWFLFLCIFLPEIFKPGHTTSATLIFKIFSPLHVTFLITALSIIRPHSLYDITMLQVQHMINRTPLFLSHVSLFFSHLPIFNKHCPNFGTLICSHIFQASIFIVISLIQMLCSH